jgi:hypothetical protein
MAGSMTRDSPLRGEASFPFRRVIGKCYGRPIAPRVPQFLDKIEAAVSDDLDVHLVMDNYATHKTPLIHNWKASSSASSKALWPRPSPASITVRVSPSSVSTPCERICAGAVRTRIWNAAITYSGPHVIGLDGVLAQQQNYTKSGFELAYANVRQWFV